MKELVLSQIKDIIFILLSWCFLGFAYATAIGVVYFLAKEIFFGGTITNEEFLIIWFIGTIIAAFKVKGDHFGKYF